MPLTRCEHEGQPGWRWGETGKCYTYTPEDPESEQRAKASALRQGRAILARREVRRDRLARHGPDVPGSVIRDLDALYKARANRLRALLRRIARERLGVRTDSLSAGAADAFYRQVALAVLEALSTVTPEEERILMDLGRRTVPYVAERSTAELRRLTGSPIPTWWGFQPMEVERELQAFRRWNADLLVDLTQRYGQQVEEDVIRAVTRAGSEEDIVNSLVSRYEMTLRRGAFIARDQTTKLSRALEISRHRTVGIEAYYWRTMGDSKVRWRHVQREGKLFDYANPPRETPDDGHPGEPPGCRCYPEPVVDGLILPDLGSPIFASPETGNVPPIDGFRQDPRTGLWVVA